MKGQAIADTLKQELEDGTGTNPDQQEILVEYAGQRLLTVLGPLLDQPATYQTVCQAISACLQDMVTQGTIVRIMIQAPCHDCQDGCGGADIGPGFAAAVNAEYLAIAQAFDQRAEADLTEPESADLLAYLDLDPSDLETPTGALTIGGLLVKRPFLFMHPHR